MIFLLILIFLVAFVLFILNIGILNKYNRVKNDAGKLLLAIKRVRYGDINVRLDNFYNKELENAANRLFETMYDREMMIKEYQNALSDKNLSLEKIIEQEKQLRHYKEEFAATLTHDMKVPVIAELNTINYLLEERFGSVNQKQTEALNLMKSSNKELIDLIENMVETYKLEQKSINLNIQKHVFNDFLNSIFDEMQPIISKNNHKLSVDIEETQKEECSFDEFQMKRVIKNIIQNAVLYSPDSSNITVKSQKSNDKIKLSVTNKGQIISKEDFDLIFQKYYTGSSKFNKAGTGLGLYLSRQIMTAHNGTIEVDCNQKDFTSFILTFQKELLAAS